MGRLLHDRRRGSGRCEAAARYRVSSTCPDRSVPAGDLWLENTRLNCDCRVSGRPAGQDGPGQSREADGSTTSPRHPTRMRPLLRHPERVPCRRRHALSDDDRVIETTFRDLKQTMGLQMLRDRAVDGMWKRLMRCTVGRQCVHLRRRSFNDVLRSVQQPADLAEHGIPDTLVTRWRNCIPDRVGSRGDGDQRHAGLPHRRSQLHDPASSIQPATFRPLTCHPLYPHLVEPAGLMKGVHS